MQDVFLNLFSQIAQSGGENLCPAVYDQGAAVVLKRLFLISAALALIGLILGFVLDRKLKSAKYAFPLLLIFAISLVLPFSHQTNACGHGGLLVNYANPLFIVFLIFISASSTTIGLKIYSKFKNKKLHKKT